MSEIIIRNAAEIRSFRGISGDMREDFVRFIDTTSAKTKGTYQRNLKPFFNYIADQRIDHPEREDIIAFREYLETQGLKATTISNYIAVVRLFFRWTESRGLYPNVADHVKGEKIDREHKKGYLTPKRVRDVLGQVDRTTVQGKRDYALLRLMITCGLRTIEIENALIEDLGEVGESTVIYVKGKGHSEKAQYVKLPPVTEDAIRDYLKTRGKVSGSDPLFVSCSPRTAGQGLKTRTISYIAKEYLKAAGYDSDRLTAHSLRHTACTLAYLKEGNIKSVKQFARHSNVATTEIYVHQIDAANNTCSASIESMID